MNWFATEEEYATMIQSWWEEHSRTMILLVALSLSIIFASDWQSKRKELKKDQARNLYVEVLNNFSNKNRQSLEKNLEDFNREYSDSEYSLLANLITSANYISYNNVYNAKNYLKKATNPINQPFLESIASLRYARILLTMHQTDKAIKILERITSKPFNAFSTYYLGLAYEQQKKWDKAHHAFLAAQKALPEAIQTNYFAKILALHLNQYGPRELNSIH
jgi:predicted negative regulator of RcsB-dependent stress response